eukprot:CAMPEP_0168737872 /NCGR_PEP_ID=MMETSP0724-20121128/10629_1 /TAXON_ID=265536 /ORGANISM="Amphiprora sp., Strain CCMP467" /LENGTH=286 /DNA_ID=CAMNT_0008785173 /DNA_START=277 /DNA_END=1134 /DNA_ORIENTATION=+
MSTSTNQDDEADEMKKAYMQFMLSGKASAPSTPSSSKKNHTPSKPIPSTPLSSNKKKQRFVIPKIAQTVVKSIDAFHRVLVDEWLSHDDNMRLVMESIADLRERIRSVSQRQQLMRETSLCTWEECGMRGGRSSGFLLEQDLELALSHSLLAHERMLTALRQGMSQMAQAQEALGRRLDDTMAHFHAFQAQERTLTGEHQVRAPDELPSHRESIGAQVEECLQLFRSTALELFRKQTMVRGVLESSTDSLLYLEGSKQSVAASKASNEWPRSSRKSPLFQVNDALD